jgi:hypothetical protein
MGRKCLWRNKLWKRIRNHREKKGFNGGVARNVERICLWSDRMQRSAGCRSSAEDAEK